MVHTANIVVLVAAAKTHFEKKALVAGTKQSKQVNKAYRLAGHAGWACRLAGHAGWLCMQAGWACRLAGQAGY